MGSVHRFLQTNTNHCAAAQNLLVQAMAEWLVDVAVVAEPYSVPGHWLGDRDGLVAMAMRSSSDSPPLSLLERGPGYVAAACGELALVGVYFSPNRPLQDFEDFLGVLSTVVGRAGSRQVCVLGDFNAKSVMWGNPLSNARGTAVELWAASTGLSLLNRGRVQTCVRRQGGSIVDLTFATAGLAARVRNWRVDLVETLSDHRYVRFDVSTQSPGGNTRSSSGGSPFPRWALTHLDREAANEAAFLQDWLSPQAILENVDAAAAQLQESLTEVCKSSMPRSRRPLPRRAVYWWSQELAELRAACMAAKRACTRSRRRRHRDLADEDRLHGVYVETKSDLKAAIGAARDSARAEMLEGLDADPFGRPYKAARNKLRSFGPPVAETLEPALLEEVVRSLFPNRDADFAPPAMVRTPREAASGENEVAPVTAGELGAELLKLRAKKTAPGPDGVPARVVAIAATHMEERFRGLFSACLTAERFPKPWKEGKVCLLHKEGRPADSPSAYRPIVLLDEVGKMFEGIIAARLNRHLRSVGPDLSDAQFGFRAGRSTVDALSLLKSQVKGATEEGDGLLAVSFDIANAFNSIPHSVILEALRFHETPRYLRRLLASYLEDRVVLLVNRDGHMQRHSVESGVPQGSVLGPLLWNIGFDWLLRRRLPRGTDVICYADDTLLTARGSFRAAADLASAGGSLVVSGIRRLGLRVALHKTEAVFFHGSRQRLPADAHIFVAGVRTAVKAQMKYLGLMLDSRWHFGPHFRGLSVRLLTTANALSGLMPNLGGPSARCRRLYAGILKSMALYGAPIWADSLRRRGNATALRAPQGAVAKRVARAYRTVGFAAACALAGTPPWELEAWVLARVYEWTAVRRARGERPAPQEKAAVRRMAKEAILRHWMEDLASAPFGRRTLDALGPVLTDWLERPSGFLSFRLVQVMTGHGSFGSYLHRIGREESPACCHCGEPDDTAQHTFEVCPSWTEPRRDMVAAIGLDLSLPSVVAAMLGSEDAWRAVASFCEHVMLQKEAAERAREEDPLAPPHRRRRRRLRRVSLARR